MGEGSGRGSGRVGSDFSSAIAGRVGSGQRFAGSGWVGSEKSDPWTTLRDMHGDLVKRRCMLSAYLFASLLAYVLN